MLMLKFYVDNSTYACDCEPIIEVIPVVNLQSIPQAPYYIVGMANFGGTPIPILDFCELMIKRPCDNKMSTRIILLKNPDATASLQTLGLMAENVTQIFEEKTFALTSSGMKWKNFSFLEGVLQFQNDSVHFVDVSKLFNYVDQQLSSK